MAERGAGDPLVDLRRIDRERRAAQPRKKDKDRARHFQPRPVWVSHAGAWSTPGQWEPGVLVEWRRSAKGWEGLCVYVRGGGELPPSICTAWVIASALRPMEIVLRPGS